MERLERALETLAERGEALPFEVLVARLERGLAGEPGVVVELPGRPGVTPPPPRRWRGPVIAAAAFLAVLAAGVGLWLGTSLLGDDTVATAPSTPATVVPPSTIPTSSPTTGTTVPPATTTTSDTGPPADAVEVARALIPMVEEALDAGDLSALPLRTGAAVELSGMGLWFAPPGAEPPVAAGREQMAAMLSWEHTLGAWFDLSDCRDEGAAGTVEITCSVEHGNALLDRVGITAFGEIAFRVGDGRITAFFDRRSTGEFYDVYSVKWVPFALRDHPDAAERMFTEHGHPILTDESAALHAALVEEWAESWGL